MEGIGLDGTIGLIAVVFNWYLVRIEYGVAAGEWERSVQAGPGQRFFCEYQRRVAVSKDTFKKSDITYDFTMHPAGCDYCVIRRENDSTEFRATVLDSSQSACRNLDGSDRGFAIAAAGAAIRIEPGTYRRIFGVQ